jgi:hypothetical protein
VCDITSQRGGTPRVLGRICRLAVDLAARYSLQVSLRQIAWPTEGSIMPSRIAARVACALGTICMLGIAATVAAQTANDASRVGDTPRQAAETQRPAVVVQQRPLGKPLSGYGKLPPSVYAAYPYGYVYNPHRAYRQGMRYGYPPVFQTWPRVSGAIYPYPYYGVYAPGYVRPMVPVQGSPDEVPQAPTPATGQPPSTLEPIPAPAGEPGS